tara:strand:+ start:1770 stop:2036 length:267 start_codon:yes stop_codon:yes gene_type:complete
MLLLGTTPSFYELSTIRGHDPNFCPLFEGFGVRTPSEHRGKICGGCAREKAEKMDTRELRELFGLGNTRSTLMALLPDFLVKVVRWIF